MIVYLVKAIIKIGKLMKSVQKFATSDSEAQKIGFENKNSIGIKRVNLSGSAQNFVSIIFKGF